MGHQSYVPLRRFFQIRMSNQTLPTQNHDFSWKKLGQKEPYKNTNLREKHATQEIVGILSKQFTTFNQFQILNPKCSGIFGPIRKVCTRLNLKSRSDLVICSQNLGQFWIHNWGENVMVSNQFILTYIVWDFKLTWIEFWRPNILLCCKQKNTLF